MIDIAIIGGGPAGLAAGIYACRAGVKTVLFEEIYAGGQITKTENIENYPGFYEGIDGFTLANKFETHARQFGLQIEPQAVSAVELDVDPKRIHCGKDIFEARRVILTMGAQPRKLGLLLEDEFVGAGISYCATCDGAFFRNKDVAVVGGGDTALTDALYLSRFAKSVTIVHRRNRFRASPALQQAVMRNDNIRLELDCVPKAIAGETHVSGLEIANVQTGESKLLSVSGVFAAVGIEPRTALVAGAVELTPSGYIVTDKRLKTSVEGVYAAGDVRDTPLRQVITAAADGAVAATMAIESLME